MSLKKMCFIVNRVETYDRVGWEPTDLFTNGKMLAGTEKSVVYWAETLVKMGFEVSVYRNGYSKINELSHNGVTYYERSMYPQNDYDVCVNIKSPDIRPDRPTIYFTNETNATDINLSMYDAVAWPSEWALDNIPVNNPRRFVIPHGYDPTLIKPSVKVDKQCIYASSPDRGLDTLLMAWPKVIEAHPDATLYVTYDALEYEGHNVVFTGSIDGTEVADLFGSSDVWVHPCNGGELFGMTAIEAQVAECVPVVIPTMALSETVKEGIFTNKQDFADDLIKTLDNSQLRESVRQRLRERTFIDWDKSTEILLNCIMEVVN